jgi:uncharacterized protein
MRIALDIDSTLHHYWDTLSEAALNRFGIDLPYEEQFDWGITRLKPKQLEVVIADTYRDAAILAGTPYPGAVEVVRAWHDAGHFIHVTSHRAGGCHRATTTWLEQIGLPFDDLHCSYDKISRCVELEIDVLVDDSPVNIRRAIEQDIVAATLVHPWNQDVCDEEPVICAQDWPQLERKLRPVLSRAGHLA